MIPDCCTCPQPECNTDESGETCLTANCGLCLHGCPSPVGEVCCLAQGVAR